MLNSELSNYTNEQLATYTNWELSVGLIGLIVDRLRSDVERWRILRDKGWSCMTEKERLEWLGEIVTTPAATKGMYTHRDMNRVESAVATILDNFSTAGYKTPSLTIKTDWSYSDELRDTDMERYYGNIAAIRDILAVPNDTPRAPSTKSNLNYERANDIEKILRDVNKVIINLTQSWQYAGEIISGEV